VLLLPTLLFHHRSRYRSPRFPTTMVSVVRHNDSGDDADAVLEQMLLEAERLSAKMRASTSTSSGVASSSSVDESKDDFTMDAERSQADVVRVLSLPEYSPNGNGASLAIGTFDDEIQETPQEKKTYTVYHDDSTTVDTMQTTNTVSAAVDASRKMALALEALGAGAATNALDNDSSPKSTSTTGTFNESPFPSSPEGLNIRSPKKTPKKKNKATSPMHKKKIAALDVVSVEKKIEAFCEQERLSPTTLTGVEWEKVEMAKEGDDDFVPLVNYMGPSPEKEAAERKANNSVQWQKVDFACKGDEDYVTLGDYSPPASPQRRGRSALSRSNLLRSRKKAQRRNMLRTAAVLLLVAFGGYWFYYRDGSSTNSVVSEDKPPEFDLQVNSKPQTVEKTVKKAANSSKKAKSSVVDDIDTASHQVQKTVEVPAAAIEKVQKKVEDTAPANVEKVQKKVEDTAPANVEKVQKKVEDTAPANAEKGQKKVKDSAPANVEKVQKKVKDTAPANVEKVQKKVNHKNLDRRSEPIERLVEKRTATTKVILSPLKWFKAAQDRVSSGKGHFVDTKHLNDLLETMLQ
jgi:hypothetical protein